MWRVVRNLINSIIPEESIGMSTFKPSSPKETKPSRKSFDWASEEAVLDLLEEVLDVFPGVLDVFPSQGDRYKTANYLIASGHLERVSGGITGGVTVTATDSALLYYIGKTGA